MEALQDFVSARLADLNTFGRLNVRARQVVRTVTSAAMSPQATHSPRPAFVGDRDFPRMHPGVERC